MLTLHQSELTFRDSLEIPTRCRFLIEFIFPKVEWESFPTQPWQRTVTTWVYKPEAANTV
jgi:hypothetical protein